MASKITRRLLPFLIIVAAILVVIVLVITRAGPDRSPSERLPALVDYQLIERETVRFEVPSQGNVSPRFATQITTEVSGRVAWMSPKLVAGGYFDAGEVMLRIEEFDYETALEEAKANVARAQASVAEERARGQVAESEWRSIQAGDIPELGLRRPQLASELANLQSAQARLAQAQRNLERTQVRAPFAGVLQSRNVNLGQFVSVNANVGTLFGTDIAEVRLPLTDFDLSILDIPVASEESFPGPRVRIRAEVAGRTYEWLGSLVRTEGVVDMGTRVTFGVVQIDDPYNRSGDVHPVPLTFGRYVRAFVEGIEMSDLVRLPRYAINSNNQVWVITDERILELRNIDVFRLDRDYAYVRDGLAEGERVMLTQLDTPLPGHRVRITDDIEPRDREIDTAQAQNRGDE
ncbi:efflux RND transporter periplasmic adaptor subunit [Aliidiomarina halalkaliphila]|uniref:Efflux RND transporter periplasmic adaptor subunit n=1 Tax=Aliidiomarina halalkaliphila TaxID=2593535 RepID=A0A552X4S0_9GAMM|nr:efflux RND transporter periplasmic adaptor subunit [Aliidiomarina halalkaliphila]TRW50018.1 efflux RND transporter periplasmic adaptor subunit [Aliidiomarina halalkaliphila]